MHDRLRNLRPYSADDALGAHQPRCRDGLQQMLRHKRVHRGNTRDVDNCELGIGRDNRLQQVFHHNLRPRAIERADDRQCKDSIPKLHNRRRKLEQFLLLARDQFLSCSQKGFRGQQGQSVKQLRCCP